MKLIIATTRATSNEGFTLDLNYSLLANEVSSVLIYNNTIYTPTKVQDGQNAKFTINLGVPDVLAESNVTFKWQVELIESDGTTTYVNTTEHTQTITPITDLNVVGGAFCYNGLSNSLTFDLQKEVGFDTFIGNISYNFVYGLSDSSSRTVYGNITNNNSLSVCINNTESYYNILSGQIQYEAGGLLKRNFFMFAGTRINNGSINNTLYDLETTLGTAFTFTIKDTNLNPYSNNFVGLMRWYPEIDEYKTVEMGKTDDKGETVLRLKTEDVSYRIAIYTNEGILIKMVNPLTFTCATSPCTYTIFISPSDVDYTSIQKLQKSLLFDRLTSTFTLNWNDPTQTTTLTNLTVTKDYLGSIKTICSKTATGFTGILQCDVTGETGTLKAIAMRSASPEKIYETLLVKLNDTLYSLNVSMSVFMTMVLLLLFSMIGYYINPIMGIIFAIIALIPAYFIGAISLAVLIGVVVMGFGVIHVMRRVS